MIATIRYWLASIRWRRFTKHLDRQIAEARAKHRPVAHLQQAKSDLLHDALRRATR